jgi:hypothetical protein
MLPSTTFLRNFQPYGFNASQYTIDCVLFYFHYTIMLVNVQLIVCYFISIMQTVWISFNMQKVLLFFICNRVTAFVFKRNFQLCGCNANQYTIDCVLFYFHYTILYVIHGSNLG